MCLKDDISESGKQVENQHSTVRGWIKSLEIEWTKSTLSN